MYPLTHVSITALLSATVASYVFGFLWYGPLFGKLWAELMGKDMEDCKGRRPPLSGLLLTLLGTFLTTMALAYFLYFSKLPCPFALAAWAGLGFYLPVLFSAATWECKPLKA